MSPSLSPAFCAVTPLTRRLHRTGHLTPSSPAHAIYRVRFGPSAESRALLFSVRAAAHPAASASSPSSSSSSSSSSPSAASATATVDSPVDPDDPSDPERPLRLSAGVRARTVVHVCASGTLCTASVKHHGVPFGSHVDYVLDEQGRPVFLLANNATHTKNLGTEAQCSLYCQPPSRFGQDGGRATLVGNVVPLPEGEEELKEAYIDLHAHAADALQYPDLFAFYRMEVRDVFFVGGYGVVSQWVDAGEFAEGEPDPLAFDAPEIVASINENKAKDLKRLCKVFLAVPDVERVNMASLDRLGFDLRVRDGAGEIREYRVAFREIVSNRFDVQSALVKAFQEAWERENGYDETWAAEDTRQTVLYYSPL